MDEIVLDGGKYRFYMEDGLLRCNRYGESWRDFIGDNAVTLLFRECIGKNEIMVDNVRLDLLIDQIQHVRAKNNKVWMDIIRLAFREAPKEAKVLMREVVRHDRQIDALAEKLGED